MSPIEQKEGSETAKALQQEAVKHPELMDNLQKRGMSLQELNGTQEIRDLARENPPDMQDRLHNFLVKDGLVSEKPKEKSQEPKETV